LISLAYLLLLFTLIALCLSRSPKLPKVTGVIGCLFGMEALGRGDQSFKGMFFGLVAAHGNATINYSAARYVLPLASSLSCGSRVAIPQIFNDC
jgi:hypothetical protein